MTTLSDYSKKPFRLVELTLKKCSLSYGVSPCTASGSTKCYNTRTTCQDPNNINLVDWTIRFIDIDGYVASNIDAFKNVISVSEPRTQIDESRGLAPVGNLTVNLQEFAVKSDDIDPYYTERTQQGHFFRRLKAINKHYENQTITIYDGYLEDDGTFLTANAQKREYIITAIDGPTDNGMIKITAKEPFQKLKKNFPPEASGELDGAITDSATSITLSGTNLDTEYKTDDGSNPSGGDPIYIIIDDEIMKVTARSGTGDSVFTVVRAQEGTTAAAHDDESPVGQVGILDGTAVEVWERLLEFSDIGSSLIDSAGAAIEGDYGLDRFDVHRVVVEPEKADKLLMSLLQCSLSFSWWDAEEQLIKIKLMRAPGPNDTVIEVTDLDTIDTRPTPKEHTEKRITRCTVYYDPISWTEDMDDKGNYLRIRRFIDTDAESSLEYGEPKELIIFAPWYGSGDGNLALRIASNRVARFRTAPTSLKVAVEVSKALEIPAGEILELTTSAIEDYDGSNPATLGWIRGKSKKSGTQIIYEIEWMSAGYAYRYWFWAPSSYSGKTYTTATEDERRYGWFADTDGEMSNNDEGYRWQ